MDQSDNIQNLIYVIRGQHVMLDFDLARLYEVEPRSLNQTVKRNARRFPQDFMFQLTEQEWILISSQFVTTSRMKRPKHRYEQESDRVTITKCPDPFVTRFKTYSLF